MVNIGPRPCGADCCCIANTRCQRAEAFATALAIVNEYIDDREDVNYEGTGPNAWMALKQDIAEAMARVEGKTTQC